MITKKLFRFSIDRISGRFVNGWCFHRLRKNKAVTMTIMADDQIIGSFSCDQYRRDLKKQHLHPSGLCGFDFSFPDDFQLNKYEKLSFYVNENRSPIAEIPRTAIKTLEPDPSKKIFFMHVPKTAGSSFNAFLRLCFSSNFYGDHIERLAPETRAKRAGNGRCISGHLPWREAKPLVEASGYLCYSIIREPFSHLHSHLNYVRRVKTDVNHEVHYEYRHNDIIRELAGRLVKIDFKNDHQIQLFVNGLSGFECDFFDNIQTRYFLDYRPEKVTHEDFENARETIDRFQLIGLTEHYDQYLNRFCQQVNLPSQSQTVRANISDSYALFDNTRKPEDTALNALVQYDRLLYGYIADRFWAES